MIPAAAFDEWKPTAAYFRAAAVAVALVVGALVWRRPDLLVIAAPFAAVSAWSSITRPGGTPTLEATVGHPTIREGDATRWRGRLTSDTELDIVTAAIDCDPWLEPLPARGAITAAPTGDTVELGMPVRSTRWGTRTIERSEVTATTAWAAFRWATITSPRSVVTLPLPAVFDVGASPRPPDGLVGLHRSSRGGEGNEFAGIRTFRPGDRLRRINWARSARSDELLSERGPGPISTPMWRCSSMQPTTSASARASMDRHRASTPVCVRSAPSPSTTRLAANASRCARSAG